MTSLPRPGLRAAATSSPIASTRCARSSPSKTLSDPEWNNTEVVADGLADRLRQLKAEDGGHVIQYGFGPVTQLLMSNALLDELRLWIYPQFVQATTADLLFNQELSASFALNESRVLSNGIVVLSYSVQAAS